MALARHEFTVTDEHGNIVTDAQVEVRLEVPGQPLASVFADRDGETPLGNPFTVDPDTAVAAFHVAGGAYRIRAFKTGFERIERYVGIGTASETDAGLLAVAVPATWLFDDATADADPGEGTFRLNNASPASATAAYIDNLSFGGASVSAWLDTFDDSGDATVRGFLTIFDPTAPTTSFRVYTVSGSVVDGTGYRKLTIAHVAGAGSFVEGMEYRFSFAQRGPVGEVPSSRTITSGTGLTGGGDLSANRSIAIDKATDANVRAAASNKVLTADLIASASDVVTLTETGGSIAVDWSTFINGTVTIDQNSTLANPTNGQPGTWRTIMIQGNNGTLRTLAFGSNFNGELPALANITNVQRYLLMIYCVSSTDFLCSAKDAN